MTPRKIFFTTIKILLFLETQGLIKNSLNLSITNRKISNLEKGTIGEAKKVLHELTEGEIQEIIRSFGIQNGLSREVIDEDLQGKGQNVRGLQKADDSVRWYLQLIGRVRLLRPEEEIQLAREISQLLHWEHVKISLREKLRREPTSSEWTAACKVSDVKIPIHSPQCPSRKRKNGGSKSSVGCFDCEKICKQRYVFTRFNSRREFRFNTCS